MLVHRHSLAAVFKDNFYGRIIPTEVYDSFELQISHMEMAADPALFVIIYRFSQSNSVFKRDCRLSGGCSNKV